MSRLKARISALLGGPYTYTPLCEDMEWQVYSNMVERYRIRGNWWRLWAYVSILLWILTLWLAAHGKLAAVLQ